MSFSSLASNQAVTFTDMQSSGVPLNSGQSAVTSTKCMQKSDLLTMYNADPSNYYLLPKANNQIIVKQDVAVIPFYYCPFKQPAYLTYLGGSSFVYNGNTYQGIYLNVDVGTSNGTVQIQLSVDQYSSPFTVYVQYGSTVTTLYTASSTTGTITVNYTYTYNSSVGRIIKIYIGGTS